MLGANAGKGDLRIRADSRRWARYWRNALADAELGRGALKPGAGAFRELSPEILASGQVDEETRAAMFAGEDGKAHSIDVVLRPRVYRPRVEHGQAHAKSAQIITPIVTLAVLTREGRLIPTLRTFVPRDLLEPLHGPAVAIGTVAALDDFLAKEAAAATAASANDELDWRAYLRLCERMLTKVCLDWPPNGDFMRADYGLLAKADKIAGAARHIVALYEHIQRVAAAAPLFDRYAADEYAPIEPCLRANAGFVERVGHSGDRYALAATQRGALAHVLAAGAGEIVAVNGPPGTGKTSLVLSVVASLWAKAAITGGEPPLILAASANNQAVTNIIDAFGRDFSSGAGPFAGHWLPEINSFGVYFPSQRKENEGAAGAQYQTRSFFERVESKEYLDRAEAAYLKAAAQAFPETSALTVERTVEILHTGLRTTAGRLAEIEDSWKALTQARAALRAVVGDGPETALAAWRAEAEPLAQDKRVIDELAAQWDAYLAREPILYPLFAWLAPVGERRLRRARTFLREIWPWPAPLPAWRDFAEIESVLADQSGRAARALAPLQSRIAQGEKLLAAAEANLARWRAALAPLGVERPAAELTLAEADDLADTSLRFQIFQLATHYWEGRWLLDMRALPDIDQEKRKRGSGAIEARWRRRMKLTPCVVSTFYMLPSLMETSKHDGEGFVSDYLYDTADLLIVDEAGQALPEVAGASFALAHRALVIGDVKQIEPIWSIPRHVDIGNLLEAKLVSPDKPEADYARLAESGRIAASGSAMRIAQHACRYHQNRDLDRGLMLYEHRRCFDEIIAYCNALCYRGKLMPMRGGKAGAEIGKGRDGLPALGYLHIDGRCEQAPGGSRVNEAEAETIAAWLAENRTKLEHAYRGLKLEEIVAVVTPFSAQVKTISRACAKAGIEVSAAGNGMTIGSIHALQGAQRPVVLFSSVYSKHADGDFIDRSASMLNVAVSRAMNSFLVFGDMDMFVSGRTTPRGRLAAHLFASPANALDFTQRPRRDLATRQTQIMHLRDAAQHDAFLLDLLAHVSREAHIVTPWLRLDRVEEIGAMKAMAEAAQRGVRVSVYTDLELNLGEDRAATQARRRALATALKALAANGIDARVVRKVHSKIVIGDDDVYCVGSFNWFSAARTGEHARHETSLLYRGPGIESEIATIKESLRRRIVEREV